MLRILSRCCFRDFELLLDNPGELLKDFFREVHFVLTNSFFENISGDTRKNEGRYENIRVQDELQLSLERSSSSENMPAFSA